MQNIKRSHRIGQHLETFKRASCPTRGSCFATTKSNASWRTSLGASSCIGGPGTLVVADTGTLTGAGRPRADVRYAPKNHYLEKEFVAGSIADFTPVNPRKLEDALRSW